VSLIAASERFNIEGRSTAGFEAVRKAFAENFVHRGELGGACSAFFRGEKVVTESALFNASYAHNAERCNRAIAK
jgi:hypothetical protein